MHAHEISVRIFRVLRNIIVILGACLGGNDLGAQDLYDDTKLLELRLEFYQSNWQQVLKDNTTTETDIPARLIVDGTTYDSIGIRYKGNSSYNIPGDKKPFNITMDSFKPDQLLYGYTTLNLNNCFKDPTFCREKIAYELASRYLPAAKAAYVKLSINGTYWGVYLNVQQLNSVFLRQNFGNNSGNNYKCDPHGNLQWTGPDTTRYKTDYEKKTNKDVGDWSDLVRFIQVLNTTPSATFTTEIEKQLDVDRALWYIAFCNVLCNLDSYIGSGHNYYLYHNPTDDRFSVIPWDMNEVLGVFQLGLNVTQLEQLAVDYGKQMPLVSKLLAVPKYRQRYNTHMRTLINEALDEQLWQTRIATHQNLIRSAVQADTKKLYSMAWFTQNITDNIVMTGPGGLTIPGMLSFVRNRRNYLRTVPDLSITDVAARSSTIDPTAPTARDSVRVSATIDTNNVELILYFSVNGRAFQSITMTPAADSLNWYDAIIGALPAGTNVRYYFSAVSPQGIESLYPSHAEHQSFMYTIALEKTPSPVVINELMAANTSGIKDPQGQFEDWFELYNTADTTVDLSGCYMTDDNNTRRWKFPEATALKSHEYLLVWADEDTTDTPGLHANFKLSKSGEGLYLYDTDARGNTLLDSVSFGAQANDVSLGRLPNSVGSFVALNNPTPGANNSSTSDVESSLTPAHIELTPSPVQSSLLVRIDGECHTSSNPTLSIIDVLGRVRFHTPLNQHHLLLDVSTFEDGLYIVQFSGQRQHFLKSSQP